MPNPLPIRRNADIAAREGRRPTGAERRRDRRTDRLVRRLNRANERRGEAERNAQRRAVERARNQRNRSGRLRRLFRRNR
jgi:hypothetical protein